MSVGRLGVGRAGGGGEAPVLCGVGYVDVCFGGFSIDYARQSNKEGITFKYPPPYETAARGVPRHTPRARASHMHPELPNYTTMQSSGYVQ